MSTDLFGDLNELVLSVQFRLSRLHGQKPLHATTAEELGIAGAVRSGIPPLISALVAPGTDMPPSVRKWFVSMLTNPPSLSKREAVREIIVFLRAADGPIPRLPTPHIGTIVRALRSGHAPPLLLADLRSTVAAARRALSVLPLDIAGRLQHVIGGENDAEAGFMDFQTLDEKLGCVIDVIDACLLPEDDATCAASSEASRLAHSTELTIGKSCSWMDALLELVLDKNREGLLSRVNGIDLDDVHQARSDLIASVTTLPPETQKAVVYCKRSTALAIARTKREGGTPFPRDGSWRKVRAPSGKVVDGRWTNPTLTAANEV